MIPCLNIFQVAFLIMSVDPEWLPYKAQIGTLIHFHIVEDSDIHAPDRLIKLLTDKNNCVIGSIPLFVPGTYL